MAMAMAVIVAVAVIVIVIVPLIVAALVNGNDTVGVIDTVDDQRSFNFVSIATMRSSDSIDQRWDTSSCWKEHARAIRPSHPPVASSLTVSITPTVSFPFTSGAPGKACGGRTR